MKQNTPEQNVAIKKMMAARARELRKPARNSFPKFFPGRTTTADYVQQYRARGREVLAIANMSHHATHPAPWLLPDQDVVIREEINTDGLAP